MPAVPAPLLLGLLACQDDPKTAPEDTGFVPDLPTSVCGVEPYTWLPTGGMGRVVASEAQVMASMPAASVDAVLAELEFNDYSPVPYGVQATILRYVTQDRGVEREVSALVTLPDVGDTATTVPVALFLHPTIGFQDACSGAQDIFYSALPIGLAAMGFATIAPDYPGILSVGEPDAALLPFLAGEPLAISSLDGLRALQRFVDQGDLPLTLDRSRVVWWGQSVGAFTALWADRYVAGYAPAWKPLALVAAVPPLDLRTTFQRAAATFGESTTTVVATALAQDDWRGGTLQLEDYFRDEEPFYVLSTVRERMETTCEGVPEIPEIGDVHEVFTDLALEALAASDWDALGLLACGLEESEVLGSALPPSGPIPVLIQAAELDDLAWPDLVGDAALELCAQGYVVEHRECAELTHAQSTLLDADSSINFLFDRLDGLTLGGACVVNPPRSCATLE